MNINERYELEDTLAVAEFMSKFGQPVRRRVVENPEDHEKILRGRLVLEEAFELVEALGLKVSIGGREYERVNPKEVKLEVDSEVEYNLVEVADALSDLVVVVKGTGIQLGIPVDEITLTEVCPSNTSKLDDDGKAIYDEGGKIIKSKNFRPPNPYNVLRKYI